MISIGGVKTTEAITSKVRNVFYGWWILFACWVITLYGGGSFFYGFSVFFKPISGEFGWSRAVTSGAFALSQAEGFIEGPIVGPLVDRFGPKKLMLIGISMVSVGFVVLSFVNSLLTYYLVYVVLLALGFNTGFFIASQTAVGNWFIKKRALALGILTTAFGFGGGIMSPVIARLILNYGWRSAAVILGIGMAAIGLPPALAVRHRPEQYGYLPDGETTKADNSQPRYQEKDSQSEVPIRATTMVDSSQEVNFTVWEALRTPAFWMLSVAFALRTFAVSAVVVHQIPLLTDRGINEQTAAGVLGLMALMSVPGRLLFGFLGDRFNKRYLLAVTYILQALGLFILLKAQSIVQLYLFTLVFGLGWGAPVLLLAIRGDYFGRKHFGTIAGVQQSVIAIGTIIGPIFAGWVFDISQSYEVAFTAFIISVSIGAVICFFAKPPKSPRKY
ncbi:MFS transporter [Chloroflexota bacterium]